MTKDYCEHCWPTRRRSHAMLHVDYHLSRLVPTFTAFSRGRKNGAAVTRLLEKAGDLLLDALVFMGIARLDRRPSRAEFHNRTLIFIDEAERRGLDIAALRVLGRYVGEFRVVVDGRRHYFDRIPLAARDPQDHTDNKGIAKRELERIGAPVPRGSRFSNVRAALRFAQELGYPLVVKPSGGSLGHHVTCGITDAAALSDAIRTAKRYSPEFIIERHVPGDLYRATVVGKDRVFVCRKDPANVVGDGVSTVEQLIDAKNAHPARAPRDKRDATLHEIPKDDALDRNLARQGLCRDSVVPAGRKTVLHEKSILSQGCDIIACTDVAHQDNIDLFLSIARAFDTDLIGIDFICEDVAVSHRRQQAGVIETNSLPYADMHQHPSHGAPDPVAEAVWDAFLRRIGANGD